MRSIVPASVCSLLALVMLLFSAAARAGLEDLTVEVVTDRLEDPVDVEIRPGGRAHVTELRGKVVIVEGGEVLAEPFLDVTDRVGAAVHGLQSVVFHPSGGYVYLHRVDGGTGDLLITRFTVVDPDHVDPESEVELIRVAKPRTGHYGGRVRFGPDGYLYVSIGDDSGNHLVDPECASQSLARLEGKVLRLDVDQNVDTPPYYGVPPDNPFPDGAFPEIWAMGFRNPWRFSFDRESGDLWIGDVGAADREEVDRQAASSPGGENYGWKVMEGSTCFSDLSGCPATVPACNSPQLTLPVIEYTHGSGCSVTGGVVYRGRAVPALYGRYLYGDFCSGKIWAAHQLNDGEWVSEVLPPRVENLVAFDQDPEGEVYLVGSGALYRLVDPTTAEPRCVPDRNHLCLKGGRFQVSTSWRTDRGAEGAGRAVLLGDDFGMFWFFDSRNPEVFVKVIDGCVAPYSHYWLFAAGLTNVEVELEVVDTQAGETKSYMNPLGRTFETITDTGAFAACP